MFRERDRKNHLQYRQNPANKEKVREKQRRKERRRWLNNEKYRLKMNLRTRLRDVMKGISKSATTMELVGCSIDELKAHIEGQFTDGMNWDNYGEWHVDHIRPCASFDLTDPEQQKLCFNYTNLQPLWAEDNLKKGAVAV